MHCAVGIVQGAGWWAVVFVWRRLVPQPRRHCALWRLSGGVRCAWGDVLAARGVLARHKRAAHNVEEIGGVVGRVWRTAAGTESSRHCFRFAGNLRLWRGCCVAHCGRYPGRRPCQAPSRATPPPFPTAAACEPCGATTVHHPAAPRLDGACAPRLAAPCAPRVPPARFQCPVQKPFLPLRLASIRPP